ncbi:MAG: hypothetical protein CMI52_03700, partial [Parcubacteria group bacterium]|nr:hypothetical protein [Parcubacteria group bacterium]
MNLEQLNEEQKTAVTHQGGPLLIIAGAGTGKTTVISHRIAWLVEQGLAKPEEILALTFTDKAASEMLDRVENLLDVGYMDLWVSTFHSFAQRILQEFGLDIGVPDFFDVVDSQSAWIHVHDNFERFELDYYKPRGNPYRFIHALISHFQRAKDACVTPAEYVEHAKGVQLDGDSPEFAEEGARLQEIAGAYHAYNQLLLDKGVMDFGDLLMYTLQLLKDRPSVLRELRGRFKYILVDEFQDTNFIQYEIVKLLAGDGDGLSVVADDDQSIYKFRGASVANVVQFLDDFSEARRVSLSQNYRSGQNILDTAYRFIQNNNPNRLEVHDSYGISKKLTAQTDSAGVVSCHSFGTSAQEDQFLVESIVEHAEREGSSFDSCAVLTRTNSHAQHVASVLEKAGVPVHFHARVGLFRERFVVDCIAWLRLLDDHSDNAACYRIMTSTPCAMPSDDVGVVTQLARKKKWSYVQAMKQIGKDEIGIEGSAWIEQFLARLEAHTRRSHKESVLQVSYAFFEDFGYLDSIAAMTHEGYDGGAVKHVRIIQTFLDEVSRFETDGEHDVHAFLKHMQLLLEAGYDGALTTAADDISGCAHVMTVHASKGLEFDYVFIPQLVHLRFPSVKRRESIRIPDALLKEVIPEGDSHIEEERRLMYVALTRAKQVLQISYAADYGGKHAKKPSKFVDELGIDHEQPVVMSDIHDPIVVDSKPHDVSLIPDSFSFTSLKSFKTCPLQFKYSHMIRIPTKGAAALSFGKSVHATLEIFYKRMKQLGQSHQASMFDAPTENSGGVVVPSLDELLEIYEKSFIDDWYRSASQKKEYKERGAKILKSFYEEHDGNWIVPKLIEQFVHFTIGNYSIRGAIDRVDQIGGNTIILDYKTGKPKSNDKLNSDDKLQLLIYAIGLEHVAGMRANECVFWYLEDGSKVSFTPTQEEIEAAKTEVEESIAAIHASDFTATPSKF